MDIWNNATNLWTLIQFLFPSFIERRPFSSHCLHVRGTTNMVGLVAFLTIRQAFPSVYGVPARPRLAISELSTGWVNPRDGLGRVFLTFTMSGSVGSDVKFQNIVVQQLQKCIVLHAHIIQCNTVNNILKVIKLNITFTKPIIIIIITPFVTQLGIPIPESFFKTVISLLDHVKTGIPVFRRYWETTLY